MFFVSDSSQLSYIIIKTLSQYANDILKMDSMINTLSEKKNFLSFINKISNTEKLSSYKFETIYTETKKNLYKAIIARNLKTGKTLDNVLYLEQQEYIYLVFQKISTIIMDDVNKQSERNRNIQNISNQLNNLEMDFFFYLINRKVLNTEIGIEIRELFLREIEIFWLKFIKENIIFLHEDFKNIGYESILQAFCNERNIIYYHQRPAKELEPLKSIISETDIGVSACIEDENKKRKKRHKGYKYPPSQYVTDAFIYKMPKIRKK